MGDARAQWKDGDLFELCRETGEAPQQETCQNGIPVTMRLTDLEPTFLKYAPVDGQNIVIRDVPMAEADGILFRCPKCHTENPGAVKIHPVRCWLPKIPKAVDSSPGRWDLVGTGFHDLSLEATPARSVLLTGGCNAHFLVTNGEVMLV